MAEKPKRGLDRFMRALKEAGGQSEVVWSARQGNAPKDNLHCLAIYARREQGSHKHRPLWGHLIIQEFGNQGFEVYFTSDNCSIQEDVEQILGGRD